MDTMKLSDFISQTLSEIIDGVKSAQEHAKENDAAINPPHVNYSDEKKAHFIIGSRRGKDDAPLLTSIDFDILLTIGEGKGGEGSVSILAAALKLGIKGEKTEHAEATNKIKFNILAKLPQQG